MPSSCNVVFFLCHSRQTLAQVRCPTVHLVLPNSTPFPQLTLTPVWLLWKLEATQTLVIVLTNGEKERRYSLSLTFRESRHLVNDQPESETDACNLSVVIFRVNASKLCSFIHLFYERRQYPKMRQSIFLSIFNQSRRLPCHTTHVSDHWVWLGLR